jgi:ribonuclease P protein component
MALPRINRLLKGDRLEEVKEKGKMVQSDNFGVRVLKRGDAEESRFAFIVSAKISKLAVHRNRVNRAFGESVRRLLKEISPGYDFVFLAKKSISKKTTDEIVVEVRKFILESKYRI